MSFWSSLKDTAESIGGAVAAPFGVVYDLASAPFDDKDDNFGTIAAKVSGRAADLADPFFNDQTWTGAVFGKTMQGLDAIYREAVSEPISTLSTMGGHVVHDFSNVGDIFSSDKWAEAYDTAQNRSIGQSFTAMAGAWAGNLGADNVVLDPMDERAYKQIHKAVPFVASMTSGTTDFIARWYLDPGNVAGKGIKLSNQMVKYRKLTAADKVDLAEKMSAEGAKRLGFPSFLHGQRDIGTRTKRYVEWTDDLEASAIFHGSAELKMSGSGQTIAGLLADANKIDDRILRHDTKRRILAVAAGDDTQIRRLQDEIGEAGSITDALKNMRRGTTLELKTQALVPSARNNPAFIASLEKQLDNLDSDESITKFVTQHQARLDSMLDTAGDLRNLPGVHSAGVRAVKRETGAESTLSRLGAATNQWAKDIADRPSAQGVFQKSVHHVPLVVLKTTGLAASPWTKTPGAINKALRQQHFQGVVNLHDWNTASSQLDVMMKIAGVEHGTRLKTLSEVYLARTEPEKMRLIDRIEGESMKALWRQHSGKVDPKRPQEMDEYFDAIMGEGQRFRNQSLSQLRGRVYAAQQRGEDGALKPRVDIIEDHGTPVALPLFETQLANNVPLFDVDLAKKLIRRDSSHMSRLARAWKAEKDELTHLSTLKGMGGSGLESAIATKRAAMDWMVHLGQKSMRVWKFGVLFRLGYPIRVLMDDHMRIATQLNWGSLLLHEGREGLGNAAYNFAGGRTAAINRARRDLRIERQRLMDLIDGPESALHAERAGEVARMNRSIGSTKANITKLRQRIEEAETKRSLGLDGGNVAALRKNLADAEAALLEKQGAANYLAEQLGENPEDLKRQLAGIQELLDQSRKSFKKGVDKRSLGQKEIVLPGGYTASGAFAGPYGKAWMQSASSADTFALQMEGAEDRMLNTFMRGSHRTIQPDEPGHLDAWADVVNRQFAQSKVARHFMKGGSVDEFVAFIKSPDGADLRNRLPHFAHDAEDWGHRVQEIVRDYLPTDELRQAALSGRVKPRQLAKMFNDPTMRPAVHGNIAAFNLGDVSGAAQTVGRGINRLYRALGELPTDKLSRHPFFAAMYKQHITELHTDALGAAQRKGLAYTAKDIERLETVARRRALADLKRTLFDISAHSHAAHVMRFVSPFFSAHQESLSRWWRIVSDDPGVVRKFQLAFDMPRNVGLVYDTETGEPVAKGEAPSTSHRIMLRVPEAWGGKPLDEASYKWTLSENSFNLVLQGGLMNPGAGPLVTVPVEALTKKYADEKEIARVARVLNPYPPDSPFDPLMPATLQRITAAIQKEDSAEWARQMSTNVNDAIVGFSEAHGRMPNKNEAERLMQRAARQTNVDAYLRVLWNGLSPAPARPESKYAVIQNGWYKISEQARQDGKDWQWARDRFVEKYGDIYLPLIYSDTLNAGDITMSTESVAQAKRHRSLLQRTDPALARMILGAEGEGEYSPEARQWFKDAKIARGATATYISDQEPKQMMVDQIVRDGWTKYSALTGALTAKATEMGLASYRDSDQLEAARKAAVEHLKQTNPLWWNDYNDFNPTDYDQYVEDMKEIAYAPGMQDTERQDIMMLQGYLELRQMVVGELERRKAAGLPYSPDAAANQPLLQRYSALVGSLVERSPDFETFMYNGLVERDPLLNGDPVQLAQDAGLVAAN